jgi:hypothetical protein
MKKAAQTTKRKKKALPDHSPHVITRGSLLFSDAQIAELRISFGFRDDFPLDARLEDEVHRCLTYPEQQSDADTRTLIVELERRTGGMLEVLDLLGSREIGLIYDHASIAHPKFDWPVLHKQVAKLRAALRRAVPTVKSRRYTGGRRKDWVGVALIAGLHRIYRHGTGRDDRYTQAPDTSDYSGPFVEFVTLVCEIAGHPLSNSFVGDNLKEILQRAEQENEPA